MFSLLPNRDNAWPDNMSPGRASLHNDSRYPANGKPELLLPLIAKDQHRRATRRYWLLVPVVLMVAAYPLLLRGLFGAVAILETLITAAVFSAGVFLWTFPGRKAAFDAWISCIVATILAFGMVGSLMEPYLIGIVFFFVFLGLSDSVFVHGLAIRGAAPCDKKRRKRLFDIYRYRYAQISPRYPVHHFLIPLFAVTLAFTIWQWPWLTTPREYVGPELFALGVCAFVWYLPLHMHIGYQMSGQKPQFGVLDSYRAGLQTLHSWFTYNLAGASTPVGFQTPAGTAGRRLALFVAALIFVSPIANPYFHKSMDFVRGEQLRAGRFLFPTDLDRQREQDFAAEELFSGGKGLLNLLEPKKKHETVTVLDKQAIRFLSDHPERGRINEDGSLTIFYDNDFYRDHQASTPNGRVLSQEYRKAEADAVLARVDRARAEYARRMVTQGTLHAVLIGFIHFVLSFLPLLTLIGLLVSTIGHAQAELNSKGFALPLEQVYNTSNWRSLVARIRTSNDATERESLLWGICQEDGSPILVPRSALREHVHFLGSTGSGKTAIGLSPLASQLMDFEDCSVVVIDLKGDDSLLIEELRCGQDRRNAPDEFFHFTSELGKGSYSFNLFKQSLWKTLSLNDKTDLLTTGLGLFHGTDYARKYYSDANFAIVEAALRLNPEVQSFSELEQQIATALGRVNPQIKRDSTNAQMVVKRLSRLNVLNAPDELQPNMQLDLASLFDKPQAWFLSLPTTLGSNINPDIARLISFSLLAAAKFSPKPRRQVYLVIDEFQRMLSSNLEVVLQLARSHDISVILANQSIQDLQRVGTNLVSALTSNTRIRQYFAVAANEDISSIIETSGEYLVQNTQIETGRFSFAPIRTFLTGGIPSPRLRVNDILAVGDEPNASVMYLRTGAGYAQFNGLPVVAYSAHHLTWDEYQQRGQAGWPSNEESPYVVEDLVLDDDQLEPSLQDQLRQKALEPAEVQAMAAKASEVELSDILRNLDGPFHRSEAKQSKEILND